MAATEQEVLTVHTKRLLSKRVGRLSLSDGLFLLPILCVAYFTFLASDLQLDDALIYLRYVRNFHEGSGLVFNSTELFNGLTSPLFTGAMLLATSLSHNMQTIMILLSGIFFLVASLLGGALFANNRFESIFTATTIASFGYFYSTFGMETGLYLALIAASLLLYRKDSPWFLVTTALLIDTRSEGVFLALVLGVDYLYCKRQLPDWRFLLAAVIVVCAPLLFNLFYYDALLPATGSAKIAQGKSGLWGEHWIFLNISYLREAFFSGSFFAPLFLSLAALGGLISTRSHRSVWLSLLFLLLLLAFYVGFNIPNYHWYYAPFFYFIILFACRGIAQLTQLAMEHGVRSAQALALGGALLGALVTLLNVISLEERGASKNYVDMGIWLEENTPEDSTIAMVEIGTVGWYSRRPIIDILGLVSPHNADYIGDREFMHWLLDYQPDFILRHEPAWGHEQSIPPLEREGLYVARGDVRLPGLVLLQRSREQTQESVREFVSAAIQEQMPFKQMLSNSEVGAPLVVLEADGLFAHAPSSLEFTLPEPVESIRIGFGVKQEAQGLHGRLCFAVRRTSNSEALLQQCIEPEVQREAMQMERVISQHFEAGETLEFEIRCDETCNYAWSYWSHVLLENSAS